MKASCLLFCAALFAASTLPAQEKGGADPGKADCCEAAKAAPQDDRAREKKAGGETALKTPDCCEEGKAGARLAGLKPAQRREISRAFKRLLANCPIGGRVASTVRSLDRVYGKTLENLRFLVRDPDLDAGLQKALRAQVAQLGKLRALNGKALDLMKGLCSPDGASGEAKPGKDCDMESGGTSGCGGEDSCEAPESSSLTLVLEEASALAASWAQAPEQCRNLGEKTLSRIKEDMALLEKHEIPVKTCILASLKKQGKLLREAWVGFCCPKNGILVRHRGAMEGSKFLRQVCKAAGKALACADKLLGAAGGILYPPENGKGEGQKDGCLPGKEDGSPDRGGCDPEKEGGGKAGASPAGSKKPDCCGSKTKI